MSPAARSRLLALVAMAAAMPGAAAPVKEVRGDISILHGGIGEEDRAAMQRAGAEYNLQLTFAAAGNGAYLADVAVTIRAAAGSVVLDTVASGPWLYARLPAGQYTVSATANGQVQSRRIDLKGTAKRDWVLRFAGVEAAAETTLSK
ncbi:MAG: hypothetical protein IT531_19375 [Burkholderiales bacterium]|nr:hypothetical protein [Burkholderiales bacterium]